MTTQEIASEEWEQFCETFTETNRNSLLIIEVIGADGIRTAVARDLPLDKMSLDKSDACNDVITIKLGQGRMTHFIIEPIHLRLRQSKDGKKLLELDAENGTTLVTFHSGRFPQVMENSTGVL